MQKVLLRLLCLTNIFFLPMSTDSTARITWEQSQRADALASTDPSPTGKTETSPAGYHPTGGCQAWGSCCANKVKVWSLCVFILPDYMLNLAHYFTKMRGRRMSKDVRLNLHRSIIPHKKTNEWFLVPRDNSKLLLRNLTTWVWVSSLLEPTAINSDAESWLEGQIWEAWVTSHLQGNFRKPIPSHWPVYLKTGIWSFSTVPHSSCPLANFVVESGQGHCPKAPLVILTLVVWLILNPVTLGLGGQGSHCGSITYSLHDFRKISSSLFVSVSSTIKWDHNRLPLKSVMKIKWANSGNMFSVGDQTRKWTIRGSYCNFQILFHFKDFLSYVQCFIYQYVSCLQFQLFKSL